MNNIGKNDQQRSFSTAERLKSFRNAFRGIMTLIRFEHNARIHLVILLIVLLAGILFKISLIDWMILMIVSGLVFISECFNTAIENLSDLISEQQNEYIRRAKDVAAAGVLLSAIISVAAGLIIFIPAFLRLVKG
jgi:diacylglycerol kinase